MNKTQINLLSGLKRSSQGFPPKPPRFKPSLFVLAFAIILICFEVAFLYTFYSNLSLKETKVMAQQDDLNQEIETLQRELVKLKSKHPEESQSDKDAAELSQKLMGGNELLLNVLETVSTHLPSNAWISYLSHKNYTVIVNGFAIDNESISHFVLKLKETHFFEEVKILVAEQLSDQKNPLKKFTISCLVNQKGQKL